MFDDVVTRCVRVLRLCVGVLRDVTVLAARNRNLGEGDDHVDDGAYTALSDNELGHNLAVALESLDERPRAGNLSGRYQT